MAEHPSNRHARDAGGEGRELELGPALVTRFNGVLRGMRLYDASNQTLQTLTRDFLSTLDAIMDEEATLVGMGDYFYVNGVRLKADASRLSVFRATMAEFDARGLGGLRFLDGLTQAELEAFLKLFLAARDKARGERLPEETASVGVVHIVPIRARDLAPPQEAENAPREKESAGERQRAQQAFALAVRGTRELLIRSAQSRRPVVQHARRVVQPVVDRIMKNEYSIVGLTALKDHDEYTYVHCVNVSVLSIRMGQLLGFSRQGLASLGVAALLHDVGKIAVPAGLLQKPGTLDAGEWSQIHRHPLEGVKLISRMPGLSAMMIDAMRVAFEHHMNVDRSGYPKVAGGSRLAVVSRLVAVADFFDAVTSHRAYRKRPMTSYEALRLMLGPERAHFDPAALWALLQTVGHYPAGSIMLMDSGHLVLSVSPGATSLRRPHCRVLVRPDGTSPAKDAPEFWDPMPEHATVSRVLAPEEVPPEVTGLLAA